MDKLISIRQSKVIKDCKFWDIIFVISKLPNDTTGLKLKFGLDNDFIFDWNWQIESSINRKRFFLTKWIIQSQIDHFMSIVEFYN